MVLVFCQSWTNMSRICNPIVCNFRDPKSAKYRLVRIKIRPVYRKVMVDLPNSVLVNSAIGLERHESISENCTSAPLEMNK